MVEFIFLTIQNTDGLSFLSTVHVQIAVRCTVQYCAQSAAEADLVLHRRNF